MQTDDLQIPSAPCPRNPARMPRAWTKYIKRRTEKRAVLYLTEIELQANPLRITTPALSQHQRCVSSCTWCMFVGRADFDFFVRFGTSVCCINARRYLLALALLHFRTLIGAYLLCGFVRAVLRCAALCLRYCNTAVLYARRQNRLVHVWLFFKAKKWKKVSLLKHKKED